MKTRLHASRDGFALAATVLALVVIGALVTGGFYAASQEGKISGATRAADRAFYLAERGVNEVLGTYTRSDFEALARDTTVRLELSQDTVYSNGTPTGTYVVTARRLGERLYFIRSRGLVLHGLGRGATRELGISVRTMVADFPMNSALQIDDSLKVTGNSSIDGTDHPPANWAGCDSTTTEAGILSTDTAAIDKSGSSEVNGDPPMEQDTTLTNDDFFQYGDMSFSDLAAMAEKVYADGSTVPDVAPAYDAEGFCDTSVKSNWGEPRDTLSTCHGYFPTIYGAGDLKISSSGAGQGILVVEGDLEMSGGFEFFGIVLVKGSMKTTGTGAHLNGMVMVAGGGVLDTDSTTTDESSTSGNSIVNFSTCAIKRAASNNSSTARLIPLFRRPWVDLSAAGVSVG